VAICAKAAGFAVLRIRFCPPFAVSGSTRSAAKSPQLIETPRSGNFAIMGARNARSLKLESLESRLPLAAELTAEGILNVTGTKKSDRISVVLYETDVVVKVNKQSHTFALASITYVNVLGLKGNDGIAIDPAISIPASILGGTGNDRMQGGSGSDYIDGGKGNDRIDGGDGDDQLFGGTGNDRLFGGIGADLLRGGSGNDWLIGWDGDDVLDGAGGNDHLYGNDGNDRGWAGNGNDMCYGGAGDDAYFGGGGNDLLFGEEGEDSLAGEWGLDQCHGGSGNDTLMGGEGSDLMDGGDGDDLCDDVLGFNRVVSGSKVNLEIELLAALANSSGVTGYAKYEYEADDDDGAELELEIEIEDATPDAILDVTIDGILVGTITVDSLGNGKLKLTTDEDDDGEGTETLLPEGLVIHAGSSVLVGTDVTGTFA
jgi:Ca2+-binding RTX toxin-like protein